jgi:hypothetical protein
MLQTPLFDGNLNDEPDTRLPELINVADLPQQAKDDELDEDDPSRKSTVMSAVDICKSLPAPSTR